VKPFDQAPFQINAIATYCNSEVSFFQMSSSSDKKKITVLKKVKDDWLDNYPARCERIASYLRRGIPVADLIFDRIYPKEISEKSNIHWTPVKIAMVAAKMLEENGSSRILDVGSGCGKFCVVASLVGQGKYFGVEQRLYLSSIAEESAVGLKANNAKFIHGDAFSLDWNEFDAFYFYNPFYELNEVTRRIDKSLDKKGPTDFVTHVHETIRRLSGLKKGTKMLTYHGYGGLIPAPYKLARKVSIGSDFLNLWIKDS